MVVRRVLVAAVAIAAAPWTGPVATAAARPAGVGAIEVVALTSEDEQPTELMVSETLEHSVSASGNRVVFRARRSGWVAEDANGHRSDVFLRNRRTGTTEIVSVNSAEEQFESAAHPVISGNGRYVAYTAVRDGEHLLFVRDLREGTTRLASVVRGRPATVHGSPAISHDGRYVAFGRSRNRPVGVYVRDLQQRRTTLVSGTPGPGVLRDPGFVTLSSNGRYVAFSADLWRSEGDRLRYAGDRMVHVDLRTGERGMVGHYRWDPGFVSDDGHQLVYTRDFPGPCEETGCGTVVRLDLTTGEIDPISVDAEGEAVPALLADSRSAVSADGRYVVFVTAEPLVPEDTNGPQFFDVYRRDLLTGTTELVSRGPDAVGERGGQAPSISATGGFVTFLSTSSNLVADDANGAADDLFLWTAP